VVLNLRLPPAVRNLRLPPAVRNLRLPPVVLRAVIRLTLRRILSAGVPPRLQRRLLDAVSATLPMPRAARVHRTVLGKVPVTCVSQGDPDPGSAVLYLHGGGFTTGSPRAYRSVAAALSRATGATVYLVDYRLAPEHPYPAALDDTLAAYRALLSGGTAAERVVLAGDSAGGHLVLAAALRLRDTGAELPAGLLLVSPWLTLDRSPEPAGSRDPLLDERWLRSCARAYRGGTDPTAPGLAPLAADLTGLPPLHVLAGAEELLVADADRLVERAGAAGVPVGYDRWPGMWHNFQIFTGRLAAADQAVDALGRAVRRWWPPATPTSTAASAAGATPASTAAAGRFQPSVVIVGAGFGGLGMAIELTKRGHTDFVVLDKADRIGGV
jgi:acetyl esterase/lipase